MWLNFLDEIDRQRESYCLCVCVCVCVCVCERERERERASESKEIDGKKVKKQITRKKRIHSRFADPPPISHAGLSNPKLPNML
jgi:hypothetical protein